jgi:hypothetical protein
MNKYIAAAIILLVIIAGVITYLAVGSYLSSPERDSKKKTTAKPNKFNSTVADKLLTQLKAAVAVKNPGVEAASAALIDGGHKLEILNTYATRATQLYIAAKASGTDLDMMTDVYLHAGRVLGDANGYMNELRNKLIAANNAAGVITHLPPDITESVPGRLSFPSGSDQNTLQPNWESCIDACGKMPGCIGASFTGSVPVTESGGEKLYRCSVAIDQYKNTIYHTAWADAEVKDGDVTSKSIRAISKSG